PGMYLRVRIPQGVDEKALLVPQQAIQRTADGLSSLIVVREGKAQVVAVSTASEVNGQVIVTKGLKPPDMVVVEGFQNIRPGVPVQPVAWKQHAAQGAAPAKDGQEAPAAPEAPAKDDAPAKEDAPDA